MSDEILQRIISSYLSTDQRQYVFGWQGGEPTLMGVDFFRRVTDLQRKYGRAGTVVSNGLQTNATLIDDKLARHLSECRFLVGASLDGPREIHDLYRKKIGGQDSHAEAVRGIRRLEEHRVAFNILVLVNQANVERAIDVYDYLCDNGWVYQQYIPCVEFDASGEPFDFSITGRQWGDFLCALFDRWVKRDIGKVSIRLFDSIVGKLIDDRDTICHMGRECHRYFVIEHNGDVYPCDFFVDGKHRLGNIRDHSWGSFRNSEIYLDFAAQKSRYPAACASCAYLTLCAGDCPKHRLYQSNPNALSFLCDGWKAFYSHAFLSFRRIVEIVSRERKASLSPSTRIGKAKSTARISRNDPCPCGSGKKYKKCCLRTS